MKRSFAQKFFRLINFSTILMVTTPCRPSQSSEGSPQKSRLRSLASEGSPYELHPLA